MKKKGRERLQKVSETERNRHQDIGIKDWKDRESWKRGAKEEKWAGEWEKERKGEGLDPGCVCVCDGVCVCVCDVPEWQAEGECQTCEKTQIRQLCG